MDLHDELLEFLSELKLYKKVLDNPNKNLLTDKKQDDLLGILPFIQEFLPKKSQEELKEELREKLVRKSGTLRDKIIELSEKQFFTQGPNKYDMWLAAFNPLINRQKTAIIFCVDAVNVAIGKLEMEGKSWGVITVNNTKSKEEPAKAFIVHGGKSEARDKLCRYLTALGVIYLIIEEEPKEGRSVNEQVEYYSEQADCAIILGTADDKELKDGKLYPRRNVYIEIGKFQEKFPKRIIYLLEEGATFPSDISEKLYTRFTQESMDEALITVARELKVFEILRQ